MQYGGHEGQKINPKPPGPFGPAKPNYRCEKDKETLFVTKVDFTSDQKCFTVFSVDCFESYDTGKVSPCYLICYLVTYINYVVSYVQDIGYRKECNEFTETKCRTVYDTKSEEKCRVVYRKQCSMVYETVTDLEYEQKCSTSYEQQCHGYGYHQTCEEVR